MTWFLIVLIPRSTKETWLQKKRIDIKIRPIVICYVLSLTTFFWLRLLALGKIPVFTPYCFIPRRRSSMEKFLLNSALVKKKKKTNKKYLKKTKSLVYICQAYPRSETNLRGGHPKNSIAFSKALTMVADFVFAMTVQKISLLKQSINSAARRCFPFTGSRIFLRNNTSAATV